MKPTADGQIDHEIQRILGTLISQELKDPRLGFVTVTRVEISEDMQHCKVFVSVIGDRHRRGSRWTRFNTPAGFMRGELGHKIDLRYTPELIFVEDRSTERAIELAKTLRDAAQRWTPKETRMIESKPRIASAEEVVAELRRRAPS